MVLLILSTITGNWVTRLGSLKSTVLLVPTAMILTLFPFSGISIAEYILSANPVFSIGTTALLFIVFVRKLFGKELLPHNDVLIFAVWNVLLCLILYSSALGLIEFDVYRFGYGSPWIYLVILTITIFLFIGKRPLGIVFLVCIGAFNLGVLFSLNLFDYLTDGILFLFSCAILISAGVKNVKKMTRPAMIDRT